MRQESNYVIARPMKLSQIFLQLEMRRFMWENRNNLLGYERFKSSLKLHSPKGPYNFDRRFKYNTSGVNP